MTYSDVATILFQPKITGTIHETVYNYEATRSLRCRETKPHDTRWEVQGCRMPGLPRWIGRQKRHLSEQRASYEKIMLLEANLSPLLIVPLRPPAEDMSPHINKVWLCGIIRHLGDLRCHIALNRRARGVLLKAAEQTHDAHQP